MTKSLKTLALISPLPPQKTGIAYYTQELIPYLSKYYDITTISTQEEADIFKTNHMIYDVILLHIGNSSFHDYMLEIIEMTPVVIVLHDFYLSNLFAKSKKLTRKLLYKEHGYHPIIINKADYPCNNTILNQALGIITHSEYSKELAKSFYKNTNFVDWDVIPLLKKLNIKDNQSNIRSKLNIPEDSFVICSFGLLNISKKNQELVEAWLASSLSLNDHCYLIFVGEDKHTPYTKILTDTIKNSESSNRIRITGWVDTDTFNDYLTITDLAVQFRAFSRGETSATVLDTLSFSIPTIVNANGSLIELPKDIVYMLEDDFTQNDLIEAIEILYTDKEKNNTLSVKAKEYIKNNNNPEYCAKLYNESIEKAYKTKDHYKKEQINNLKKYPLKEQVEILGLASFDKISQCQIFVDVSAICKHDLKTGIQNVVKSQLKELLKLSPENYRIEPVYLIDEIYYYAKKYTLKLIDIQSDFKDEPIEVNKGDLFYGLDLSINEVQRATKANIYKHYKTLGVKFVFMIYDLLPLTHSQFFLPHIVPNFKNWLNDIIEVADHFITISNDVAKDLNKYTNIPSTPVHLGVHRTEATPQYLSKSSTTMISFLTVGTIEPRKGYVQLLQTFEMLWKQEMNVTLNIVGKQGWMMDVFINKLLNHAQLNKKLFYYDSISDENLNKLYQESDCLIAPSQAEGFGLPLIEAAFFNLPIIARDISVFREVAKESIYYFQDSNETQDLVNAIKSWITLYQTNSHPLSKDMPYLTWEQNAQEVLKVLIKCTEH